MTDNNVTKLKEPLVLSPPKLLEQAIASGAGVEVIERLLGLQERWEGNQAKRAFNSAIAAFKADPPEILKTVEVGFEGRSGSKTSYKHEDLAELLAAVDPALAAHGLWVRFKVSSTGNVVKVTCLVGHADGYSEEASSLEAAPDTSGAKNAVQAIGSAVSYLQRYTVKAALGLAAARDDDGKRSGAQVVTPEQAKQLSDLLKDMPKKDVDKFLTLAGLDPWADKVTDIMAVKFDAALKYLQGKVEKK